MTQRQISKGAQTNRHLRYIHCVHSEALWLSESNAHLSHEKLEVYFSLTKQTTFVQINSSLDVKSLL